MNSVTNRKAFLCLFWIILFLFQNRLQQVYESFQYIDELFAALFIPVFVIWNLKKKECFERNSENGWFLFFLIIFWLSGWAGYFRYQYQPLSNTFKDSFVNLKFFMASGTAFLIFADDELDFDQMRDKLWPILNGITVILFVLCLLDLGFGIFSTGTRGGMRAVKLFYSAYTFLVSQCVCLSAVYLWFYKKKQKKIALFLCMLAFIMLSTRRAKAMGAVACILLVYLFVFHNRQKISKKVKILTIGVLGLAVAGGMYQLISYYYTMGVESARAVLTIAAPFIAIDHFPFGTGWGTYGSAFSADPYSPIYGMYRMAGVWGMSPNYHEFLTDTFWPMILGQCGYLGFAAFIVVLVLLKRKIFQLKPDKAVFASALVLLLYLLISSTSESAFANPMGVPMAFWLGLLFAEYKVNKKAGESRE
ncbi:MAG: hypothetical protein PUG60_05065 [Lachnospiraceae bacterium]|nr:hypothetical protein [Lachnospiraceae bacterium]MDY4970518.1 hypothetical protein [Lachnospiraceae bacterium]